MTTLFIILAAIGIAVCGLLFIPTLQACKNGEKASLLKPAIISLFVMASSLLIYGTIGSPKLMPRLAEYEDFGDEVRGAIEGINDAIKKSPGDAKLYADLGTAYNALQKFVEAREAFRAAVLLSKGNPDYIMALGRAEMAAADGQVNDAAKKAFEMVLLQDKTNLMARYYLALGKKQSGDSAAARRDFEGILKDLPEGIPLRGIIEREMKEE